MSAGRSAVVDLCSEGLCFKVAEYSFLAPHLGGHRPLLCREHANALATSAFEVGGKAALDRLDLRPPIVMLVEGSPGSGRYA